MSRSWVQTNGTETPPEPNPSLVWLFDLSIDPYEFHNVADTNPSIVAALTARLEWFDV